MEVAINYWAVLVCGVWAMVLGFLWYGPVFGAYWMKLMGITHEDAEKFRSSPDAKRKMNLGYGLTFVAALVMACVLAHVLAIASGYLAIGGASAGLTAGFWSWLGFVAPVTLGSVLWEQRPWMLWVLNNAYWLILLLGMGLILDLWV